MDRKKLYVKVNADHFTDGTCIPKKIVLPDGRSFEVDRVCHICRASSLKVGGIGLRYTVRILGKETYLFDEENGKWFVEAIVY